MRLFFRLTILGIVGVFALMACTPAAPLQDESSADATPSGEVAPDVPVARPMFLDSFADW